MSAKPPPNQFSPALVDKIHAANLANIARKVQEKKSLTGIEVKQLNDAKRSAGFDAKSSAESILSEGLIVMGKIKTIIEASKLTTADKREIFQKIAGITIQCTGE